MSDFIGFLLIISRGLGLFKWKALKPDGSILGMGSSGLDCEVIRLKPEGALGVAGFWASLLGVLVFQRGRWH